MIAFADIADELDRNGFEAEPFGPRTLAIKAAPVGLEGRELERMLEEVLGCARARQQTENAEARRRRIAASIACHAAIKVNHAARARQDRLAPHELGKTEHPTACPHGGRSRSGTPIRTFRGRFRGSRSISKATEEVSCRPGAARGGICSLCGLAITPFSGGLGSHLGLSTLVVPPL